MSTTKDDDNTPYSDSGEEEADDSDEDPDFDPKELDKKRKGVTPESSDSEDALDEEDQKEGSEDYEEELVSTRRGTRKKRVLSLSSKKTPAKKKQRVSQYVSPSESNLPKRSRGRPPSKPQITNSDKPFFVSHPSPSPSSAHSKAITPSRSVYRKPFPFPSPSPSFDARLLICWLCSGPSELHFENSGKVSDQFRAFHLDFNSHYHSTSAKSAAIRQTGDGK